MKTRDSFDLRTHQAIRGTCWLNSEMTVYAAYRTASPPFFRSVDLGSRVYQENR
jgi:formylglycine-generating enzyme required for sulfatase activity